MNGHILTNNNTDCAYSEARYILGQISLDGYCTLANGTKSSFTVLVLTNPSNALSCLSFFRSRVSHRDEVGVVFCCDEKDRCGFAARATSMAAGFARGMCTSWLGLSW